MTTKIATTVQQFVSTTSGPLFCALTGKPVKAEDAYWAPPLITTRELVSTVVSTTISTPGNLGHILLAEQPDVPYLPEVKDQLAQLRSAEQAKLLFLLLLIAAVIFVPVLLLAMR